ncbi:hypothetical protein PBY51_013560 [Eleginops maclovinus]|uniref:Uncharacterized protein n=1 Tax=Eleginops maclovinus TaxID=56733 RepID=A0AAN7Y548_ELEMC|nr:hypothetical protein PBY51_013560 [Eleginops maclovinus]
MNVKRLTTNLRSSWGIIIHGNRQLSPCFPKASASLEMTWKLNPNTNTLRENQDAEEELRNIAVSVFSSFVYLCSQGGSLSFQPACISSADATVNWCALVWKREVLLGAS